MEIHDWVMPCRVALHRSLNTLVLYENCIEAWIVFEPADNVPHPWIQTLKQFKGNLKK